MPFSVPFVPFFLSFCGHTDTADRQTDRQTHCAELHISIINVIGAGVLIDSMRIILHTQPIKARRTTECRQKRVWNVCVVGKEQRMGHYLPGCDQHVWRWRPFYGMRVRMGDKDEDQDEYGRVENAYHTVYTIEEGEQRNNTPTNAHY